MTDAILEHALIEDIFDGASIAAYAKNIFVSESCMTNPYIRNGIIHEHKGFNLYNNLEKSILIHRMVKEEVNYVWGKKTKRSGATLANIKSTLLEKRAQAFNNALRFS